MKDILFLLKGPAVYRYLEIFISDWQYASSSKLKTFIKVEVSESGKDIVQVVPSGPDLEGDALFEALMVAIYSAQHRIWIVTPYFTPDITLMRALIIAKHRGVDVKLITPYESDHILADLVRSSYMRELEENRAHVALYTKGKLHAKAILFDNTSVMLGSVNFDSRSLFLNYEVVSFAYSHHIIHDVEKWMISLLKDSNRSMPPAGKYRRVAENFMRIFAPQI
jgi:cardiolipin synthase